VNKKKQKNFFLWSTGVGGNRAHYPAKQKFFGSRAASLF
jgi:hypothetical protein